MKAIRIAIQKFLENPKENICIKIGSLKMEMLRNKPVLLFLELNRLILHSKCYLDKNDF